MKALVEVKLNQFHLRGTVSSAIFLSSINFSRFNSFQISDKFVGLSPLHFGDFLILILLQFGDFLGLLLLEFGDFQILYFYSFAIF